MMQRNHPSSNHLVADDQLALKILRLVADANNTPVLQAPSW